MEKKLLKYAIYGAAFAAITGTLLHFTYEWSNRNPIVALFAAVNESTWEHLKIAVFPLLFFFLIEYFLIGKHFPNYWIAKLTSLAVCIGMIVAVFNTYTALTGHSILAVDISLFYISILSAQYLGYKIALMPYEGMPRQIIALLLLLLITAAFLCFTYFPPHANLFCDPLTGSYGI